MGNYLIIEIEDAKSIKPIKTYLESINGLNKQKKISRTDTSTRIFTYLTDINDLPHELKQSIASINEYNEDFKETSNNNSNGLVSSIIEFFNKNNLHVQEDKLIEHIPKKWSIYPPMILFNYNSFDNEIWHNVDFNALFEYIRNKKLFGSEITHFAVNQPIIKTNNEMRKPVNLIPLYGDFGPDNKCDSIPTQEDFSSAFWCTVIQNGIFQTWCPKYTMFSRGNIKEKARILSTYKNLNNSIVFDLYCGIGYFSLSYLKNGATLFCWELNPWSIEGFRRSINGKYKYRIVQKDDENFNYEIYQEDIKKGVRVFLFVESNENVTRRLTTFPSNSLNISHINLGLLPTSYNSWLLTRKILQEYRQKSVESTLIHIHENYHIDEIQKLIEFIKSEYGVSNDDQIKGINKIKSYAPDIWHLVIDLQY
ncbi:S-adenosyl-L-methionine-dependent methyltransferase [Scheffersomyces amazonensis]|uniref:S-adenosyl-L-methionine-dependent methyltransferase n=1 Tax=Scheffersomyces amazonensis TaxID=1078765 RepID=UPI00315D4766